RKIMGSDRLEGLGVAHIEHDGIADDGDMERKGPGGCDAGRAEGIFLQKVVDGDAPFMHLVGIDRGDGVGIERHGDQAVSALGLRLAFHRDAQWLSLMEMERPCPSSASTSARVMAASLSAASEAGSQPRMEVRLRKSSTPSPEAKRAERAVGST